jgi:DNA-binding NarL/FixJ family response regulator
MDLQVVGPPGLAAPARCRSAAPPDRLRLLVIDSHQPFRECLAAALGEDPAVARVEAAAGAEAALERLAAGEAVDVLLLGGGGAAAAGAAEAAALEAVIAAALVRCPGLKILVLGGEEGQEGALALLRAGARGYLFRDQSLAELRSAIFAVAAGETVCTPRLAPLLFSHLAELRRERRRSERLEALQLSARELEVLRLIGHGLGNPAIAARLHLSVHTVKNHVRNIFERLGVNSRWSAVGRARDKGWLAAESCIPCRRIEAGARGYVPQRESARELVGEPPLSAREREVLDVLAAGRCNKDIARQLGISVRTVKNHVHSLLGKLGARRRREALRIACELGLAEERGAES